MGWSERNGGLEQDFKFRDFATAWTFMCRIAKEAEAMDHHPEWTNVYNRVSIRLTTHSKGGITDLDHALAAKINKIFKS